MDSRNLSELVTLNGFLSQAYGVSDGNQILGIPADGTAGLHNLAIQARFEPFADHRFVLQLSHEQVGDSPVQGLRDAFEIDWLFYEYHLPSGFYLKAGRAPIPFGIYNEFRDAGTLLPFYTPPISLYFEDQFTAEHVDGLVAGYRFFPTSPWSLTLDVYGGGWTFFESGAGSVAEAEADNALGAQLWIETPLLGLRLGVGANRYDVSGGLLRVEDSDRWQTAIFSIDADFEPFLLRAELLRREVPVSFGDGASAPKLESDAYYVQLGYRFSPRWAVYLQVERGEVEFDLPSLGQTRCDFWRDVGLSVTYSLSTQLFSRPASFAFKAEVHDNEGYLIDDQNLSLFFDEPAETTYGLLSVAVAF